MNKFTFINILKKILITTIVIFIFIMGAFLIIAWLTRPTPDHKRNISETDARIEVSFSDERETRNAIIRTYKEEEYKNFDEKKISKIMDIIGGNIEGDIPAVHLREGKNKIYVSFFKDDREVIPDHIPEIEIIVLDHIEGTGSEAVYEDKIIKDKLENQDGKYSYGFKRYLPQYEKYFVYYSTIKIPYEIDGEKYISIFGLNASNANEGSDFFNNEELEEPLEPEE